MFLGTVRTPENFYLEERTWVQALAVAVLLGAPLPLSASFFVVVRCKRGLSRVEHWAWFCLPDSDGVPFPPHPVQASLLKLL